MASGIALDDADRFPWLCNLRDWMSEQANNGISYSVVSCSALKRHYRDILREAQGEVSFIHLAPPLAINCERIAARQGHYMKADMLDSQLAILEPLAADENGVLIDNAGAPAAVQEEILTWLKTFYLGR